VIAQVPAEQTVPASQATPQAPQLSGSRERSVQAAAPPSAGHAVCEAAQVRAHEPAEQTVPGSQTTPQAPQFSGSRATTVHSPAHVSDPAGQDAASSPLHASAAAVRSARAMRLAAGHGGPRRRGAGAFSEEERAKDMADLDDVSAVRLGERGESAYAA
jgi:hypothetical protein